MSGFILLNFWCVYAKLSWSRGVNRSTSLNQRQENKFDIGVCALMMKDPSGTSIDSTAQGKLCYKLEEEVNIKFGQWKFLIEHTAREKFVWIWSIKSFQPISLIECKLFIDDTMVILVQFLILCNLFPHTMTVIVIRNCIFMTFSPQEVLQDKKRVKLET